MWHTVVDTMLSQQWHSVGQTVYAVPHMARQWLTMPQTPLLSRHWRGAGMRIGIVTRKQNSQNKQLFIFTSLKRS